MIYFIQNQSNGHVKIGHSNNVQARLTGLQTSNSNKLKVCRVIEGDVSGERWLHRYFSSSKITGEWFRFHDEMKTVFPPEYFKRPDPIIKRRDVKLSLLEKLNKAKENCSNLGIPPRHVIGMIAHDLTDEQAADVVRAIESINFINPSVAA